MKEGVGGGGQKEKGKEKKKRKDEKGEDCGSDVVGSSRAAQHGVSRCCDRDPRPNTRN